MLKPRFTFYITLPGSGEQEFFPINDTAIYAWVRENDIWRKKLDTALVIANHGGLNLFDILGTPELEECGCTSFPIRLTIKCPMEEERTLYSGTLILTNGEWNWDQCKVELEPVVEDPFTCMFRHWETDKNILLASPSIEIATDLGEFEYATCSNQYNEDYPGNGTPTRKTAYEDDCLLPLPGHDWRVLSHEVSQDSNQDDLFVTTKWVREVFNGVGPPAGNGWNQVSGIFWTRRALLQGPKIEEIDTFFKATWTLQSKILDNGRLLSDVLNFLISDCPDPIVSDYLGIDPDGTAPMNDAYAHAQQWLHNAVLFSTSDVVKNDAEQNATKAIVNLKDLWLNLKLFAECFLFYDYSRSAYRIEHVSYKRYSRLINMVANRPDAIRGYNSYTYVREKLHKKESYSWGFTTNTLDWDTASIIYSECAEKSTVTHRVDKFHTDFGALVGSEIKDIEILKGLTLVSQFEGQVNRGVGAISLQLQPNAGLSWANMIEAVWKWNRPECTGIVNGNADFAFESLLHKIKQTTFTTEMGCYCDDIIEVDPNIDQVRTGLGTGIIDDFSINLESGQATWVILHAPPITLIDEDIIIPPITIMVSDNEQCYYTDFVFTLDIDLNNLISVDWDFGLNAIPATGTGEGPHIVQYTAAGTKTVTVVATYENQEVTAQATITVLSCPGNITGHVLDELGNGVAGCIVRLYADDNADGIDEGSILGSSTTSSLGAWVFTNRVPRNYVMKLAVKPVGSTIITGEDETPDGDIAPNFDITDDKIPSTLGPSEVDDENNWRIDLP